MASGIFIEVPGSAAAMDKLQVRGEADFSGAVVTGLVLPSGNVYSLLNFNWSTGVINRQPASPALRWTVAAKVGSRRNLTMTVPAGLLSTDFMLGWSVAGTNTIPAANFLSPFIWPCAFVSSLVGTTLTCAFEAGGLDAFIGTTQIQLFKMP